MKDYEKINYKMKEVLLNIESKPFSRMPYPLPLDKTMRISLQLKREGHYYSAFEIAYDNLLELKQNHPDFIMHLYKNIACSGALSFAAYLQVIYVEEYGGPKVPNNLGWDHLHRFMYGLNEYLHGNKNELFKYLNEISGSSLYSIPLKNNELFSEVNNALSIIGTYLHSKNYL